MDIELGDAVLTEFGTGVVTSLHEDRSWATLRLNRQPGKSVASGILLTVKAKCLTKKLVAASGMIVRGDHTKEKIVASDNDNASREYGRKYLVEDYVPEKDIYLASLISIHGEGEGIDHGHSLAKSLSVMSSPATPTEKKSLSKIEENGICEQLHNEKSKIIVELKADQIDPSSTSAKFYPMLEDLMQRGEKAWSALDTD